ncbi:LysR substrate-binding domain-containing protein [Variovorax robiniae]|uniref:LysR substrate-binding domain-containing protein n=1 Tax=Variovorax robiniae TaxID=1836199 RepID=A0ABU8XH45_9BURK
MPPRTHSRLSLARTLKLHQLAVFDKVIEAGSFVAASRTLAMTQPAVTKSIHELERHLGEPLFVRGKRGVALTTFGTLFEHHAKSMLAEVHRLADGVNSWQTGASGQVVVGTLLTASTTLLPEAIARLREAASDVAIEVRLGTNASLFPLLANGELDLVVGFLPRPVGLAGPRNNRVRLTHAKLYDEALCAVVHQNHPMMRRRKLSLRDLHDLEWILPTPDSVAYDTACAMFEAEGLALPSSVVHSVSVLTNIGLLAKRPMVALMPRSAVEPFVESGTVSVLPLGALGSFGTVGYTLRADRDQRGAMQLFLVALKEASLEASRYAVGGVAAKVRRRERVKPPHPHLPA